MKSYTNKILMGFCVISIALLAGCNTVKGTVNGAGEDIQQLGTVLNPQHKTSTTSATADQLSTKLDATSAPIKPAAKSSDIPEESY